MQRSTKLRSVTALLATLLVLGAGQSAAAQTTEGKPLERDASAEPECPPGWYCERPVLEPPPPPPIQKSPTVQIVGRLLWVPMPTESSSDALLLGAGAALRYRYARPFAIEFGGSGVFGRDYLGVPRREWTLDFSQLILGSGEPGFSPFALVGLDLTLAHREEAPRDPVMLGAHMGFGASAGVHENVRLMLELDLNWRTRVDADPTPEYRDPATGATSDSTMAIVLRAGASFDL